MTTILAHFDGQVIVPDEPLPFAPGEKVRVTIERESVFGAVFTPFPDMTATLMNGDEWDESAAIHVDTLDRVPPDFVRQPGSGAGEIKMTEDFGDTPAEFEEYL